MNQNYLRYFFSLRNQLALGASFSSLALQQKGKQCYATEQKKPKYFFKYASTMIPHPDKVYKGGEDAIAENQSLLAVADGVGGWADHGIDPGLYSKELCKHISEQFLKNVQKYIKEPQDLIIKSYGLTKAIGSTTLCILTIDNEHILIRSAFIGDSGYAIYRKQQDTNQYEIIFKSQEQQKGFNFPYQIGSEGDNPSCSIQEQHTLNVSDLLVLGTDGLFDNLSANQIKLLLDEDYKKNQNIDLKRISNLIANYAYKLSLDPNYASPFARSARQQGYNFKGGKSDDITVIVAEINQNQSDR